MTLKVRVNDLHFQYQPRVSQDAYLVQIWWFYPKSVMSYRADKPNFVEFWVKKVKITLKVKVNDLHFQYQPRVSQDACMVQIWRFQLKSVTSYRADKVKFTGGRTDGQTEATTIPLRPERPRGGGGGGGVKINWLIACGQYCGSYRERARIRLQADRQTDRRIHSVKRLLQGCLSNFRTSEKFKHESRGFDTTGDLAVKRLATYRGHGRSSAIFVDTVLVYSVSTHNQCL